MSVSSFLLLLLLLLFFITLCECRTYFVMAKRDNNLRPIILYSNFSYNYNPTFGTNIGASGAGFLLVRSQNRTSASDPYAVGQSVITFTANVKNSFVFTAINDSNVILRSSSNDDNFGVEDPRLTYDAKNGVYMLLYSAVEDNGTVVTSRLALATAKSHPERASSWSKLGPLFPQLSWSKSGAMLIRPSAPHYLFFGDSSIVNGLQWATSNDLYSWNLQKGLFLEVRNASYFDSGLVEAGPMPVRLSTGDYLLIYNSARHGFPSKKPGYDFQYNVGYAILNGTNPSQVLQRSAVPLLSPVLSWELGSAPSKVCVPNVVFAEGIQQLGVDKFRVYYGAADAVIGAFDVTVSYQ